MTKTLTNAMQARLRLRGITVSDDPEFVKMVPWTSVTFLSCGALVGLATTFSYSPALWTMTLIAGLGALMPRHPFDAIYNHVIRRIIGTVELPTNEAPVRFACAIAVVWLMAAAMAFEFNMVLVGYTLGSLLAAVATLVGTTHFCIPSAIYQLLFGGRSLIVPSIYSGAAK